MKRKQPVKKSWAGDRFQSQIKPLTATAKRKRAEYLRSWSIYMGQLLFAETERR